MLTRQVASTRLELRLPESAYNHLGFAADDTNLYRYVRNDPTNKTDPSGLFEWKDVFWYMNKTDIGRDDLQWLCEKNHSVLNCFRLTQSTG